MEQPTRYESVGYIPPTHLDIQLSVTGSPNCSPRRAKPTLIIARTAFPGIAVG